MPEKKIPFVVVLYCQQGVRAGETTTVAAERAGDLRLQAVELPCSSKVQVPHLLQLLAEGANAVEVIACPEAACRFLTGSRRAEKRLGHARRLLQEIGLNPRRLGLTRQTGLTAEALVDVARRRLDRAT